MYLFLVQVYTISFKAKEFIFSNKQFAVHDVYMQKVAAL